MYIVVLLRCAIHLITENTFNSHDSCEIYMFDFCCVSIEKLYFSLNGTALQWQVESTAEIRSTVKLNQAI